MNTLSPELISPILHHLHCKTDLSNFRLVQRSFADLGAPYLFRIILLEPSQSSLSRLLSISSSPKLSHHVKEIFVGFEETTYMVWPEFAQRLRLEGLEHGSEEAKEILQFLVDEWNAFFNSQELVSGLEAAFQSLPRLEALTLTKVSPKGLLNSSLTKYPYASASYFVRPTWYERKPYYIRKRAAGTDYFTRMFTKLVDAVYPTNVKLTHFKVWVGASSNYLRDGVILGSPNTLSRAAAVFRTCRVLKLGVHLCFGHAEVLRANSILSVVAAAEQLRELDLSSHQYQPCGGHESQREGMLFEHILGNGHIWPQLEKICFPSMRMHEHDVIAFLKRHKKTLKVVGLGGGMLVTGDWASVMMFIKEEMKHVGLELPWSPRDLSGHLYKNEVYRDEELMRRARLRVGG